MAEKITAAAPLAVWASRRVILAADDQDEATLRKMSNDEFAGDRLVRGLLSQRQHACLHPSKAESHADHC